MYNDSKRSIAEQTVNNATCWVGHRNSDNKDIATGQTFVANAEGELETIAVFPTLVTRPGRVVMTVHDFDSQENKWGASLGSAIVELTRDSNNRWVPFYLNGLHLTKGKTYGFKLESSDTYIGIGEAAFSAASTFISDKENEWKFENSRQQPFHYFSLAYKVGLKAA